MSNERLVAEAFRTYDFGRVMVKRFTKDAETGVDSSKTARFFTNPGVLKPVYKSIYANMLQQAKVVVLTDQFPDEDIGMQHVALLDPYATDKTLLHVSLEGGDRARNIMPKAQVVGDLDLDQQLEPFGKIEYAAGLRKLFAGIRFQIMREGLKPLDQDGFNAMNQLAAGLGETDS